MIRVINEANSATIELYGDIGASWFGDGWTFERFSNEVKSLPVSQLTIKVKSNGGDVFEAFAIHDAIKALPARVTVDIVGASASAATIIAAAGIGCGLAKIAGTWFTTRKHGRPVTRRHYRKMLRCLKVLMLKLSTRTSSVLENLKRNLKP